MTLIIVDVGLEWDFSVKRNCVFAFITVRILHIAVVYLFSKEEKSLLYFLDQLSYAAVTLDPPGNADPAQLVLACFPPPPTPPLPQTQ